MTSNAHVLLGKIVKEIGDKYKCILGKHGQFCETGEEYVILDSNGIRKEGQYSGPFDDPEQAVMCWKRHFDEYAATHKGHILYWRQMPVLQTRRGVSHIGRDHLVYSRLVISEKEVSSFDLEAEVNLLRQHAIAIAATYNNWVKDNHVGTTDKSTSDILAQAWFMQVPIDMDNRIEQCDQTAKRQAAAARQLAVYYHGEMANEASHPWADQHQTPIHKLGITGREVVAAGAMVSGAIPLWAHYISIVRDMEEAGVMVIKT